MKSRTREIEKLRNQKIEGPNNRKNQKSKIEDLKIGISKIQVSKNPKVIQSKKRKIEKSR